MTKMQESSWPSNCTESLYDICLEYVALNLGSTVLCESADGQLVLKSDLFLPTHICDALLSRLHPAGREFLPLFASPTAINFRHINLKSITDLTNAELQHVLTHHPTDLRISSEQLTADSLSLISSQSHNLRTLHIVKCENIFSKKLQSKKPVWKKNLYVRHLAKRGIRFRCPKARYVALCGLQLSTSEILCFMLADLTLLTRLDLSHSSIDLQHLRVALSQLQKLQILSLYSVKLEPNLRDAFEAVAQVKSLRALDLSQHPEDHQAVMYADVDANMTFIVSELPLLKWLDISGTNLCGWMPEPPVSHRLFDTKSQSDATQHPSIAGLHNCQLDFLGLLNCAYNACSRENLPAAQLTGDATEAQILLSVNSYIDHRDLLLLAINNLFRLFKYSQCRDHRSALEGLLAAMKHHLVDKSIQISASATVFYIVKGAYRPFFTTTIKKVIVRTLLKSMENHLREPLILRNCCLTLYHLHIPHDVLHSYKWLVLTLLKVIESTSTPDDEFVQKIAVYLLNSLSCQVDYSKKQLVGSLGAFPVMLSLINTRVEKGICDEVLKVSWSMMWNVTDETPSNCQMFIDGSGLDVFLACFSKFKADGSDLLRNMLGLLGNVAEVQFLRCHLVNPTLISIFRDLLGSTSDGIEVSYNACGIFANIVSDGADAWTITTPSRQLVLRDMSTAISQWKLDSKRNINYRSLKPILRLLSCHETPEVQYWAVWALCNLTKVYRSKYCPMLMRESGVEILKDMLTTCQQSLYDDIVQYVTGLRGLYNDLPQLAECTINRCERFAVDCDYLTDDEHDEQEMND